MGEDGDQHGREESAALARLYDAFAPALFRAACGLLGSAADAEDVVHDVFVAAARAGVHRRAVIDLRAYLFAALRRAAFRRRRRRTPGPLPAGLIDPRPPAPPRDEALERALARLPEEQRAAVVLKLDGGLTFAELAVALGVGPNTAASRYRYALAKLRAELERPEP